MSAPSGRAIRLGVLSTVLLALLVTPIQADSLVQSTDYQSGALGDGPYQTFVSSDATPAQWNFWQTSNDTSKLADGYVFMAPRGTATKQPGGCIYNQTGELIWSAAANGYSQTMQFAVQQYNGNSVITMWQGTFNAAGYGSGYNLLFDSQYKVIANVTASGLGDGIGADLHEFRISPNNTGLLTAYIAETYDLSSYDIDNGTILNCVAQEVNIETGEALFTWKSLDHVLPSECYVTPGNTGASGTVPWDYFHINSIEKDSKGNFLISSRHCKAVYYVNGSSGDIIWRLGGMNSTFTMGNGTNFEFQHDARWRASNDSKISIFDNAATSWETDESYARGLLISLDFTNMSATLETEAIPYNMTVSQSQGNVHQEINDNLMVGWGQTPWFGEYDPAGNLLWTVQYGVGDVQGYRVFRFPWSGYPITSPSFTVVNSTAAYASWNGATEIALWQLYGSNDGLNTTSLGNFSKTGFETYLEIPSTANYTYYQISAMSNDNAYLGWSYFVAQNGSATGPSAQELGQVTQTGASSTAMSATSSVAANTASAASASASSSSSSKSAAVPARTVGLIVLVSPLALAMLFAVLM